MLQWVYYISEQWCCSVLCAHVGPDRHLQWESHRVSHSLITISTLRWRHNDHDGSQITNLTVVYSTIYSDPDQRKHQCSTSLAFVWGIHRDRWIPCTKGQLRGKCFHLMTSSWSSHLLAGTIAECEDFKKLQK